MKEVLKGKFIALSASRKKKSDRFSYQQFKSTSERERERERQIDPREVDGRK
jgi:hypothetical protein